MGFASVVVEISPSFQAKDSRDGANMGQHIFNKWATEGLEILEHSRDL
jgi:hypothetical protein